MYILRPLRKIMCEKHGGDTIATSNRVVKLKTMFRKEIYDR